ncbi:MAG: alpha/beta hydrolase [Marinobacter sp.]|uniref:alpha/beta hydrolase fold domain-containing protein n=1 Tax=Marinobacter sp. TaxID=50741 RepID=UPI0034A02C9E
MPGLLNKKRQLISTVWLGLLLAGCANHINAPEQAIDLEHTDYSVRKDIVFSPADWPQTLKADLYLPDGEQTRPAVLMVHGGGWERRSRQDMNWIAEHLTAHGIAVMNIDYRFAPEFQFPAQLHDLQIAMHWLRGHAAELKIDPDRVGGFGFSSGAHLVSLLATLAGEGGELNEPHGGPETRLEAIVAGGLPSDLRTFGSGKLLRQFLGGTRADMPDVYRAASPVTHVTEQTPPFFLFHGGMDTLVPTEQATDFRALLEANGVENELYILRFRGHITSFLTSGDAVDEATVFLVRHLGASSKKVKD